MRMAEAQRLELPGSDPAFVTSRCAAQTSASTSLCLTCNTNVDHKITDIIGYGEAKMKSCGQSTQIPST